MARTAVGIARDFADRHRERARRAREEGAPQPEAEHAIRVKEAGEMERKYKESDANRFSLVAQLRQQQARDTDAGPARR
jgi:hypothetical protein